MAQRIIIDIPEKVSANKIYSGMHWRQRKELADLYHWALIEHRAKRFKIPAHLSFAFTFKGRLLDCSNCFFMAKMLEDAMVLTGILPGDTPAEVASISVRVERGTRDTVTISGD